MKFKSEIGIIMYAATVLILGGFAFAVIECAVNFSLAGFIILLIGMSFAMLIFLPILFCTNYTFSDYSLVIKSGFIKYEIDYSGIISVKKSHNPISSPALSLNRLEIVYSNGVRKGAVLISPKRRNEFMTELLVRAPFIETDCR